MLLEESNSNLPLKTMLDYALGKLSQEDSLEIKNLLQNDSAQLDLFRDIKVFISYYEDPELELVKVERSLKKLVRQKLRSSPSSILSHLDIRAII